MRTDRVGKVGKEWFSIGRVTVRRANTLNEVPSTVSAVVRGEAVA